jgi:ubiquinone/menaquinone biosynthesis C-methylase UbiE
MSTTQSILQPFLILPNKIHWHSRGIPSDQSFHTSSAIQANSYFFGHPQWGKTYLETCHRDNTFKERWQAVTGSWDGKIIVDIGCGPGNVFASLGGLPKLLIGVDISPGALAMAQQIGYTPLLADAHNLPLMSNFADLVVLNATLHHCQDMVKVLREAARLVRPGGLLVVDHDPQLQAWNYKGLGMLFYKIRLPFYRFVLRNLYIDSKQRTHLLLTEIHHKPGDGVTSEFFYQNLEDLGFAVKLYPHNNNIGKEALQGNPGKPPHWRYRFGQRLSGINPNLPEASLSLMCVAERK